MAVSLNVVKRIMRKTTNASYFLIFNGLALMYCFLWMISSFVGTLIFAIVSISLELFVNHKYNTSHCIFMFASLAPAFAFLALFKFNPTYSYADWTFIALIFSAFRMLLSVFESVKRKKYAYIPLSLVLSGITYYLSFAVNEYQYDILHKLGVFAPK